MATPAQRAWAQQALGVAPAGEASPEKNKVTSKPEAPAANAPGTFAISASVGRGGTNNFDDVKAVQVALNRQAKAGLGEDGKCGAKTIAAIVAFQKSLDQANPDGRIDPGKGTARALAGGSGSAAPSQPALPGPSGGLSAKVQELDRKYQAALKSSNWGEAAEILNAFNKPDIQSWLGKLSKDQVGKLHEGAVNNPRVGPGSNVAQMTVPPGGEVAVPNRVKELDAKFQAALKSAEWETAAELLNAFNRQDIQARLNKLSKDQVGKLHEGAVNNRRVGPGSQIAQMTAGSSPSGGKADSQGRKFLVGGTWNKATSFNVRGGQSMHFVVKNQNVLGTSISIASNRGGKKAIIILPRGSVDSEFSNFGKEPMGWSFDIDTSSDAFIVSWELYSTWVEGDAPNG